MRVKMLKSWSGPTWTHQVGDIVNVEEPVAKMLVAGGDAQYVDEPVVKAPETASVEPAEEATAPESKPKPRSRSSRSKKSG